jgi:hypothetical protein
MLVASVVTFAVWAYFAWKHAHGSGSAVAVHTAQVPLWLVIWTLWWSSDRASFGWRWTRPILIVLSGAVLLMMVLVFLLDLRRL